MGCPSSVVVGQNLVFSVVTHDPDTGVLTDADAVPAWQLYQDEDDDAGGALSGDMAKLDDANTVGFYTELINCTSANGFVSGKNYTIYITADVGGDTAGYCYTFRCTGDLTVSITAPSAASLCTVQFRVNLSNTPVEGAICYAQLEGINHASDGTILSNAISSDTTDALGIAELELVRKDSIVKGSGIYKIWVEISGKPVSNVETTIPNQSTFLYEDLLA